MTRLMLLVALCLAAVAVLPSPAAACFCAPPARVEESLSRVDAVFVGTVTRIRGIEVSVAVRGCFKGEVTPVIPMVQGDGGACGYAFLQGETYLIYADEEGFPGWYVASICERTATLREARTDLAQLALLAPPVDAERAWGELLPRLPLTALVVALLVLCLAVALAHRARRRRPSSGERYRG